MTEIFSEEEVGRLTKEHFILARYMPYILESRTDPSAMLKVPLFFRENAWKWLREADANDKRTTNV